jgi:hypothetical protein
MSPTRLTLYQVVIPDGRRHVPELHREIGALHLATEDVLHGLLKTSRRIDIPLAAWIENRGEERESLNVIPVRVANQNMPAQLPANHQLAAQNGRTGAGIEHDQCA